MAALALFSFVGLVSPATASERPGAPPGFDALHDVDPMIRYDIRYVTRHNFVGERIDGYRQPLTRQAATALRGAQRVLLRQGYTLKVYDCYRPQRAVDHVVRWAKDLDDERMKAESYPNVEESRLFADGYIAEKSGHSRGSTLDVTLVKLPARHQRPYRTTSLDHRQQHHRRRDTRPTATGSGHALAAFAATVPTDTTRTS